MAVLGTHAKGFLFRSLAKLISVLNCLEFFIVEDRLYFNNLCIFADFALKMIKQVFVDSIFDYIYVSREVNFVLRGKFTIF